MGKWSEVAQQTYNVLQTRKKEKERGIKAADYLISKNNYKIRMAISCMKKRGFIK
jgi:hypothetical protein